MRLLTVKLQSVRTSHLDKETKPNIALGRCVQNAQPFNGEYEEAYKTDAAGCIRPRMIVEKNANRRTTHLFFAC